MSFVLYTYQAKPVIGDDVLCHAYVADVDGKPLDQPTAQAAGEFLKTENPDVSMQFMVLPAEQLPQIA